MEWCIPKIKILPNDFCVKYPSQIQNHNYSFNLSNAKHDSQMIESKGRL